MSCKSCGERVEHGYQWFFLPNNAFWVQCGCCAESWTRLQMTWDLIDVLQ